MATQTISFKGEFDASGILNSIKHMRSELAKNGDTSLLGNIDKEIAKIEALGSTIQAQIGKGFSSTKEFRAFESNISKLELEISKIGQSFSNINGDQLKNTLKTIDAQVAEVTKRARELSASFKMTFSTDTIGMSQKARKLANEIADMAKNGRDYEEVEKRVSAVYDDMLKKQRELIAAKKQEIQTAESTTVDIQKSGYQKRQFTSNGVDISSEQLKQINTIYSEVISKSSTAKQAIKNFRSALQEQSIEMKNAEKVEGTLSAAFTTYNVQVKERQKNINDLNRSLNTLQNQESNIISEEQQFNSVLENNSNKFREVSNAAKEEVVAEQAAVTAKELYNQKAEEQSANIENLNSDLKQSTEGLRGAATATGEAVKQQEEMNNSLDSLKSKIAYVFSLSNAYQQVRQALTDTFNDIKSIDSAFASIAMVTEQTISGLWDSYGDYAKMAQRMGQSTESAIKASALFYQQGLDTNEALVLTEETMRLATLADLDFENATSQMTAALRGFHMEMDQGAHVTDVYSELAAHAAADVNGIAYAMSKTASIAYSAGMSFETTSAFLTQMIETTQEAPENIGELQHFPKFQSFSY